MEVWRDPHAKKVANLAMDRKENVVPAFTADIFYELLFFE